jgi:hypothetical protein
MKEALRIFSWLALIFGCVWFAREKEAGPFQTAYHLLLIGGGLAGLCWLRFAGQWQRKVEAERGERVTPEGQTTSPPSASAIRAGYPPVKPLFQNSPNTPRDAIRAGDPTDERNATSIIASGPYSDIALKNAPRPALAIRVVKLICSLCLKFVLVVLLCVLSLVIAGIVTWLNGK